MPDTEPNQRAGVPGDCTAVDGRLALHAHIMHIIGAMQRPSRTGAADECIEPRGESESSGGELSSGAELGSGGGGVEDSPLGRRGRRVVARHPNGCLRRAHWPNGCLRRAHWPNGCLRRAHWLIPHCLIPRSGPRSFVSGRCSTASHRRCCCRWCAVHLSARGGRPRAENETPGL